MHHQARQEAHHVKRVLALAACLAAVAGGAPKLAPLDETGFRDLLAAHKGKVVLFDFWATWCEPCREEMPVLASLEKELGSRGLVLLTVSADEPEQEADASEFLSRTGIRPPAYIKRARSDEDFINFIDRKWSGALPALFLYGRDGKRAASFIGETDRQDIEAAIRKLL